MKTFTLIILFIGTLAGSMVQGQNDSIKQKDSINTELLKNYNLNLKEIDQESSFDAKKKAELEKQLSTVKESDNLKKEALLLQLQALNDKEANRIADKKLRIDSLRSNAKSYPILGFFDDTLFLIYSSRGSFSAFERANAVNTRLRKLGDDFTFNENTLKIVENESAYDIIYGENILISISENDAIWSNENTKELAKLIKNTLTKEILRYKDETSLMTLAKEIGLALLVISFLVLLLIYCVKLFKWTAKKIALEEGKKIKEFKIKDYTLFDAKRLVSVITVMNTLIKWLVILLLTYIALPIIFGFFPWTENFAETLFGYIFNPLKKIGSGLLHYLPNLFTVTVIFMVFKYAIKGIEFLKSEIENGNLHIKGFYPDWANPTFQLVKVVLFAFMFVLIFPYLPGSDSPVFRGVSVFLGFLLTFGSAGPLSNIVAGIVLTYMRLFKNGDRVKIGEVVGDVIEKSLLVTRIRTIKNEIISIPNSNVMSSHTINYSNEADFGNGLIMHTTVTIGYDVPWQNMHKALIEAANRTNLFLKNPAPFVLQTSLDDFYVSYQINAYTKHPNQQANIYSELHQNIQDSCNEAGIEILSPHYRSARDGNATTIPSNYLDKNYQPPSFQFIIKQEGK
ncbi:MAG: mechanosensitive ion channel family protein [bacterium]|nr:mechanosensitive ion channel family protein [bacterium]